MALGSYVFFGQMNVIFRKKNGARCHAGYQHSTYERQKICFVAERISRSFQEYRKGLKDALREIIILAM